MQEIVSPLQSISYTNKDFQRIYPELLDLVKQLTNKWDPSISNESDPGVILIKLNALIADKCNYNIDKNVLECFPLSVTQTKNARQLFEQLGYRMKWYRSATAFISLKWVGEVISGVTYTIPAFTMITDTEKTIVYTLVGTVPTQNSQEFVVSPLQLSSDGTTLNAKAIQGVAVKYDINGDTIITPQHLDQDNRIYFNVSDIAENGIFITNVDANNYSSWIQKDNLAVEEYGNTFYKFGVTADASTCYLEFPEDAETIMKDGIEITYIRTLGSYGTVKPQQLRQFYSDISVVSSLNDPTVLSTQNVSLINYFASTQGQDSETINEAYKNYKRMIGTYNTLITLRDYLNYILSNNLASNGFTCDRSNDIQTTYDIMEYSNGLNIRTNVIETDENDKPLLTAFSLKLYLLKYFQDISSVTTFNDSFSMENAQELQNTKDYISDLKALQHDYAPILPTNENRSNICFFKNKYPLKCTIIPQYRLSNSQEADLKNNICTALYQNLNSQEIEFGDEIQQEYLRSIILASDSRIKNVILDNIEYTTYAVYMDANGNYNEVSVSGDWNNKCNLLVTNSSDTPISTFTATVDSDTFVNKMFSINRYNYSTYLFQYMGDSLGWGLQNIDSSSFSGVDLADYGITLSGDEPTLLDKIYVQVSKETQFKDEIFVKSVLAGITPFFVQNEEFDVKLDQLDTHYSSGNNLYDFCYSDIKNITVSTRISMQVGFHRAWKMRQDESVQLFAPNLLQKAIYNNYVKFEINLVTPNVLLDADSYYELRSSEYVIFYWKSSSSSSLYQFAIYGQGCIIKPSFILSSSTSITSTGQEQYQALLASGNSNISGTLDSYSSSEISALTASENILSSDKEIGYYVLNNVVLDDNYSCYWVLNATEIDDTKQYYTLFEDNQTERILESGEYFFYTNNEMQSFVSLGSGTRLIRSSDVGSWKVNAINLTEITLNGIAVLSNYWFKIPSPVTLTAEEDQFILIESDYVLRFQPKPSVPTDTVYITAQGAVRSNELLLNLNDYIITYTSYPSRLNFSEPWSVILSDIPESEWVYLPDYNFSTFSGWNARSVFSFSCSKEKEQILLNHQQITITDINDNSLTITGQNQLYNPPRYPVVIKSNKPINITGSNSYNTVSYGTDYTENYTDIYIYTKLLSTPWVNYFDQSTQLIIKAGDSSSGNAGIPKFSLLPGNYIFPVSIPQLPSNQYMQFFVYRQATPLENVNFTPIYDSHMYNLHSNTMYPMSLITPDNPEEQCYTYNISVTLYENGSPVNATVDLHIVIGNPYKYESSDKINKILYLINNFDPNHKFNYTYQNDDSLTIIDPLEAKQFLNQNHIYHDFTICQLDTSSLNDLKVNYS